MKLCFIPFFSQQDKTTGKHLLANDSAVRMYSYMASQCAAEGWEATFAFPPYEQHDGQWRLDVPVLQTPNLPVDNLDKRLHWDSQWLKYVATHFDCVVTSHETYAIPLRCYNPKLTIVTEVGFRPGTSWAQTDGLMYMAWRAATALHCSTADMQRVVRPVPSLLWKFSYDEREVRSCPRKTVDVIFGGRCSATGYSKHETFLAAMANTSMLAVVGDPTSYLRANNALIPGNVEVPITPYTREQYLDALSRSAVAVSLIDHGGVPFGFPEAIACGCTPVALKTPAYMELLTVDWPYYCVPTADSVRAAVKAALTYRTEGVKTVVQQEVKRRVAEWSYQSAWRAAKEDIRRLAK